MPVSPTPAPTSRPPPCSHPLVVTGLSVTYPDRTVLAGVDLLAPPGRRVGLVGENGSGKSTLLRAVAGRLPARAHASGSVAAPDDLVLLGQEPVAAAALGGTRAAPRAVVTPRGRDAVAAAPRW